jgi:hypothetical protein
MRRYPKKPILSMDISRSYSASLLTQKGQLFLFGEKHVEPLEQQALKVFMVDADR